LKSLGIVTTSFAFYSCDQGENGKNRIQLVNDEKISAEEVIALVNEKLNSDFPETEKDDVLKFFNDNMEFFQKDNNAVDFFKSINSNAELLNAFVKGDKKLNDWYFQTSFKKIKDQAEEQLLTLNTEFDKLLQESGALKDNEKDLNAEKELLGKEKAELETLVKKLEALKKEVEAKKLKIKDLQKNFKDKQSGLNQKKKLVAGQIRELERRKKQLESISKKTTLGEGKKRGRKSAKVSEEVVKTDEVLVEDNDVLDEKEEKVNLEEEDEKENGKEE